METTVTLKIPSTWIQELELSQSELNRALMLGLAQIRQQRTQPSDSEQVIQVLQDTGRIYHLSAALVDGHAPKRQPPPVLPETPASEVLIVQRRGKP
ncbi:MAG: hypothetical protein KKA73_10175 [Chloroflexi bacterium]|nr:hypothetical protein [Chloroflexota bacterium]MBU1748043.1 hypothetical protein [Chloroflexota bacterium]